MLWLVNPARQKKITTIKKAEHFWTRLLGMLQAKPDQLVPALWFPNCTAIHTMGMKFPLDVIFLDEELRAIKILLRVPPMKAWVGHMKANSILEIISGRWDTDLVSVGDQLAFS